MITVHMVGNAHLDPVWLWEKFEGIDAVMATARSACKRLDEYPGFIFTCSSSWFHRQVEMVDPELFARVVGHVKAGRWRLVGGMVIQPDCNLPSEESFLKQLQHGRSWFLKKFGQAPTIGYNVDSFGHTAYMPRFLRQCGMDSYVFMRPEKHQVQLPSNLFRWQSPDGFEVPAFRIPAVYSFEEEDITPHIRSALEEMPSELNHTMCFYGVGDHGGGPTKKQIEWIMKNASAFDGAKLVFSHPRAFFDANAGEVGKLPVYRGELENVFRGCYLTQRPLKAAMRKAEAMLTSAERAIELFGRDNPHRADFRIQLDGAWEDVLFNEFHDVLGGTSLPGPSALATAQLQAAQGTAGDIITHVTRQGIGDVSAEGEHRLVLVNLGDADFDGVIYHDPWLPAGRIALHDEHGLPVPCQAAERRPVSTALGGIVFKAAIQAGKSRILKLTWEKPIPIEGVNPQSPPMRPCPVVESISNGQVTLGTASEGLSLAGWSVHLEIRQDTQDSWGGTMTRYDGELVGNLSPKSHWRRMEDGPVRWTIQSQLEMGRHEGWCRAMLEKDSAAMHLNLRLTWSGPQQILRLRLKSPCPITGRMDLISGGPISRPLDGLENHLAGAIRVETAQGPLAVVSPDLFSGSVDAEGVSLTLLRSPYFSHVGGGEFQPVPHYPTTDQGVHEFNLKIIPGLAMNARQLKYALNQMLTPPLLWDMIG
jgi:alpha-mannosidase